MCAQSSPRDAGEFNCRDAHNRKTGWISMIAVIGGGSIGVAFAIVFARAGRTVRLYEPDASRRAAIPDVLQARLADLHGFGLLGEAPEKVAFRVSLTADLGEAVSGVAFA